MKNLIVFLFVSSTAVSMASECVTYISAGQQYQVCSNLKKECALLFPSYALSTSEVQRRSIRATCGGMLATATVGGIESPLLPIWRSNWRIKDCTNLKRVYKTTPSYTLAYKRYIWDTCRSVPPLTWGTRP
ncbi:exported hypothetical protein [Crenothrix polyspora]|uniref:Uncharacterized protein n=1 Tax=Crenothrix polyspora TaxID=360316 RepID=A0A1R4HH80_9GAMM|nr:exported hypothetical protein [Crenothrix polyspora]